MTFAVVSVAENRERIIGTIWASGETEAQQMASSLFPEKPSETQSEKRVVRRAEQEWEIPLRVQLS